MVNDFARAGQDLQPGRVPSGRVLDGVIAGALLLATLPLLVAIAILIKWENPGPVFDATQQIGMGGQSCRLLKFRTTSRAPDFARRARVTGVGDFVIYTRIEYLPRLINVIRGDISLREALHAFALLRAGF